MRILLAILTVTLILIGSMMGLGCERKIRVKLKVKSPDAGLVTESSTKSAR